MVMMMFMVMMVRCFTFYFPMIGMGTFEMHCDMGTAHAASFGCFGMHVYGTESMLMDIECIKSAYKSILIRDKFKQGTDDHIAGSPHRTI
jgi:hypothetical protein